MTRREEIVTATLGCRQSYVDLKRPITPDDVADAFEKGAYWADKTMKTKMLDKVKAMLDNYIRQLKVPGRQYDAIMLITGKQEAALRILELLQED